MLFSTFGLISALLISFAASAPAELEARLPSPSPAPTTAPAASAAFGCIYEADPDGAEGLCPAVGANGWCACSDSSIYAIETGSKPCGYTTTPAAGPITLQRTGCSTAASPSIPAASPPDRNKCSQEECPKLCDRGSNNARRTIEDLDNNSLIKRFYQNPNEDDFPYKLLDQPYTRNICPSSPSANTYIWKKLSTQRGQYAAALQGLCGCTTIFVASGKGVFSSHIWEADNNKPPRDLQPANYKATLTDLKTNLSPNKDDLSGGQAFLIIPVDPKHTANYLYGDDIVNALKQAISDASGITPAVTTYIPLDFKRDTELGTNRRGTASFEFDPAHKDKSNGSPSRAYRVISEGNVLALKTGLLDGGR